MEITKSLRVTYYFLFPFELYSIDSSEKFTYDVINPFYVHT